jgi:hypothetical protein
MKDNGVPVNNIYAKSKKAHKRSGLGGNNVQYTKEVYKHLARYITVFLRTEL